VTVMDCEDRSHSTEITGEDIVIHYLHSRDHATEGIQP
jgi:hypothetical protein